MKSKPCNKSTTLQERKASPDRVDMPQTNAKVIKRATAALIDMTEGVNRNKKLSLSEASYGGAYYIADDQFFTREDLLNACEEVLDHINETFTETFILGGTWFEEGKWIVKVQSEDGMWEWETKIPVDMRKIREPRHLKRAYAFKVASNLIQRIKEDAYLNESIKKMSLAEKWAKKRNIRIVKESVDGPILKGPDEGAECGLSSLLNTAIQNELKTVEEYNTLAINARAEGYEDIARKIDEINTEENVHIGELQELLKTLSPNAQAIDTADTEN